MPGPGDSSAQFFSLIAQAIDRARDRVLLTANAELVNIYWQVGGFVKALLERSEYGDKTVQHLSDFLQKVQPGLKGFDRKNIYRMVQFYDTWYRSPVLTQSTDKQIDGKVATPWRQSGEMINLNVATLWRQFETSNIKDTPLTRVNWSMHKILMGRCKLAEEREFYLRQILAERYSVRELERQISASLFERFMLDQKNLSLATQHPAKDSISGVFKDVYIGDFINLPEAYNEKDLQRALVQQMKHFILELGRDFIFMGNEYRLEVGDSTFYIDLLFFHRTLNCLVVFELKADKFKPAHLGQLNFYLEALDRDVKKEHENPSIGVLLCKDKDEEVVKYALSRNLSPALVAEYKTKLPDKKVLQQKLRELFENTTEE